MCWPLATALVRSFSVAGLAVSLAAGSEVDFALIAGGAFDFSASALCRGQVLTAKVRAKNKRNLLSHLAATDFLISPACRVSDLCLLGQSLSIAKRLHNLTFLILQSFACVQSRMTL